MGRAHGGVIFFISFSNLQQKYNNGEKLLIVKESKDWLKVEIDEDIKGWIAKEFVDITTEFQKAETIEEENERLRREAAERVVVVDNTAVDRKSVV